MEDEPVFPFAHGTAFEGLTKFELCCFLMCAGFVAHAGDAYTMEINARNAVEQARALFKHMKEQR